jgi:hypothetical protein
MQEWLTVTHYLGENVVWATRLSHEKPIVPKLVVDGKSVLSKSEVNPSLRDMVGEEACDANPSERAKMVSKLLKRATLGQLCKPARAVIRCALEKLNIHGRVESPNS